MDLQDLGLHGLIGNGSNIKSIQRGVTVHSGVISISAVDLASAILIANCSLGAGGNLANNAGGYVALTDSTHITCTADTDTLAAVRFYWEVLELKNIKNIQRGLFALPDGTTTYGDISVSAVDTSKSSLIIQTLPGRSSGSYGANTGASVELLNSNTIRVTPSNTSGAYGVSTYWQLVEFK